MRCETLADDGERCVLEDHPNDRDGHDFAVQSGNPVDGGQKWSKWIEMVNGARGRLMPDSMEGDRGREGRMHEWGEETCRAILQEVALHLDLDVMHGPDGIVIREPSRRGQGT